MNQADLKIGQKVHYVRDNSTNPAEYENGMIKEIPEHTTESVRVVYNCAGDWENFQNYTSALTPLTNLRDGWKMQWTDPLLIRGKEYRFESVEDDPLTFLLRINKDHYLQREINCDVPTERISLVKEYTSVQNGIPKPDTFSTQVYHGQEIESKEFLQTLLEHALYGINLTTK